MNSLELVLAAFDRIKKISPNGAEYWMARDVQAHLGYSKWSNFEEVIKKGIVACKKGGNDPVNHIALKGKMVPIGSGAYRSISDYYLSRYGAYLVAMNGDPSLEQIALAQIYFAIQTRRQEISDQAGGDISLRIELRSRVRDANKHLGAAAKEAGVQNYGLFHDAGYRGLYTMGLADLKVKKGLGDKEDLLDRAGRVELAANEFRITQTEERLKKNDIKGDSGAQDTHEYVGKEVRKTIEKIGGTKPEELPTEPSIKLIEREAKKQLRIKRGATGQKKIKNPD